MIVSCLVVGGLGCVYLWASFAAPRYRPEVGRSVRLYGLLRGVGGIVLGLALLVGGGLRDSSLLLGGAMTFAGLVIVGLLIMFGPRLWERGRLSRRQDAD